jgi:hypothetical protein
VLGFAAGAPVCLVGYLPDADPAIISGRRQRQAVIWPKIQLNETTPNREGDEDKSRLVSTREGQDAARQIGAVVYIEWTGERWGSYGQMEKVVRYGYYYQLSKSAERRSITSS